MYNRKSYESARDYAQKRANTTGRDYGLEVNALLKEYRVFALPMRQHRFGHELRCEVVSCEDIGKTAIGHGYK